MPWCWGTSDEQIGTNNLTHAFPRGKALGGSSAINYMMFVRGQATEYNDWARITGYQSWAWSGLQPLFLKHEAMTVPAQDEVDTGSKTTRVFENESMAPLALSRRALELGLHPWKKPGIRPKKDGIAVGPTQGCLEWISFGRLFEP